MKKFCISLLLVTAGMYAAESSTSATELVVWGAKALHERDGVSIALSIKSSMDYALQKQFVRMFLNSLAIRLGRDTSFQHASKEVRDVLTLCEIKVKDAKVEAFFEGFKKSLGGEKVKSTGKTAIQKMLLTIALEQSGVKLKVEGSAEPKTCQTFFPPYTLISEGNNELTPAERERARLQEEAAQSRQKLAELSQQLWQS